MLHQAKGECGRRCWKQSVEMEGESVVKETTHQDTNAFDGWRNTMSEWSVANSGVEAWTDVLQRALLMVESWPKNEQEGGLKTGNGIWDAS